MEPIRLLEVANEPIAMQRAVFPIRASTPRKRDGLLGCVGTSSCAWCFGLVLVRASLCLMLRVVPIYCWGSRLLVETLGLKSLITLECMIILKTKSNGNKC